MSLAGKRALVSGASGHIGGAICRTLASLGAEVIAHAHKNTARSQEVVREIHNSGGKAEAVCFDVSDGPATRQVLDPLVEEQPVQILVHAAGYYDDGVMAGMSEQQWRGVVDVTLNGFFNVTQPLLLPMLRTRWGRIVAISSISGVMGNRGQSNYAAAKAGLHGAIKSLALECASRGITANAIAPGIIATPETSKRFSSDRVKALVPMQRAGDPQEVASLVGFLASDKACYITGQVIAVSGGLT